MAWAGLVNAHVAKQASDSLLILRPQDVCSFSGARRLVCGAGGCTPSHALSLPQPSWLRIPVTEHLCVTGKCQSLLPFPLRPEVQPCGVQLETHPCVKHIDMDLPGTFPVSLPPLGAVCLALAVRPGPRCPPGIAGAHEAEGGFRQSPPCDAQPCVHHLCALFATIMKMHARRTWPGAQTCK